MSRWRKRREPAVHDWLWRVNRIAAMIPSTTQSSSASGNTIDGLLPPSSSDTGTIRSAAAAMTSFPTSVDPVNESLRTSGWCASGAPHSSPNPVSTLRTPGGRCSLAISASRSTASGASSAAFITIVFPAHGRPCAILTAARSTGAFQGMMAPTTPSGSRRV